MSRLDLAEVVRLLPSTTDDGEPPTLADVGCASAAQIFPMYLAINTSIYCPISTRTSSSGVPKHTDTAISPPEDRRHRKPGQHHDVL